MLTVWNSIEVQWALPFNSRPALTAMPAYFLPATTRKPGGEPQTLQLSDSADGRQSNPIGKQTIAVAIWQVSCTVLNS
jgi:hypothetical protein